VRPGTFEFLAECSKFYEIIIFTASAQDYADKILNTLDPEGKLIHHRLYRQHVSYEHTSFKSSFKDLKKIGRDLSKIIFIDNSPENFKYDKENGVEILTWKEDPYDNKLHKILSHLLSFAKQEFSDVRQIVEELNKLK
jgi:Dullard-like phosphatase family protein